MTTTPGGRCHGSDPDDRLRLPETIGYLTASGDGLVAHTYSNDGRDGYTYTTYVISPRLEVLRVIPGRAPPRKSLSRWRPDGHHIVMDRHRIDVDWYEFVVCGTQNSPCIYRYEFEGDTIARYDIRNADPEDVRKHNLPRALHELIESLLLVDKQ